MPQFSFNTQYSWQPGNDYPHSLCCHSLLHVPPLRHLLTNNRRRQQHAKQSKAQRSTAQHTLEVFFKKPPVQSKLSRVPLITTCCRTPRCLAKRTRRCVQDTAPNPTKIHRQKNNIKMDDVLNCIDRHTNETRTLEKKKRADTPVIVERRSSS